MSERYRPETPLGAFVNSIEENLIALLLGLMTLIQFANVVARYGFNSNLLWALEATVFLFAWLVLLGASYAVKIGAHLGVDALINVVGPKAARVMSLIAIGGCIVYAFLLFKGSWDYWAPFAGLYPTSGHWFPTGFEQVRSQGWYEVNDIVMPEWLQWIGNYFNDGDRYEKIPRFIPYVIMPVSMGLLLFRFIQAGLRLWRGEIDTIIASHEAEEAVEEASEIVGKG